MAQRGLGQGFMPIRSPKGTHRFLLEAARNVFLIRDATQCRGHGYERGHVDQRHALHGVYAPAQICDGRGLNQPQQADIGRLEMCTVCLCGEIHVVDGFRRRRRYADLDPQVLLNMAPYPRRDLLWCTFAYHQGEGPVRLDTGAERETSGAGHEQGQ